MGGLAALLGFVSAAAAETTISLIWQATGSNVISNPITSSNIVLDVFLNGDSEGTTGGGLTVDYGTSGAVTVVSFTSNPVSNTGLEPVHEQRYPLVRAVFFSSHAKPVAALREQMHFDGYLMFDALLSVER